MKKPVRSRSSSSRPPSKDAGKRRSAAPRSSDDAPRSEEPRARRPFSDAPRSAGPRSSGPRSDSRSEAPRSAGPRSSGPRSDSRSDAPRSAGPRSSGPRSDSRSEAPRSAGPRSSGPRSDSRSDSPRSAGPRSSGPRSDSRSDSPRSAGPRSSGPRSDRPRSDSPRSAGPRSGAPSSESFRSEGRENSRPSFRRNEAPSRGAPTREAPARERTNSARDDFASPRFEKAKLERTVRTRPVSRLMGRSAEGPAKRDFGRDSGRDAKREGAGRDFQVWGRRPVEAFLSDLTSHTGELDVTKYSLHIIHDKSGKVPLQLKPCVDLSQALGLKIKLHKSEEDEWPLNPDDALNHQRICLRTPNLPTSDITEALNIVRTFVADGGRGCVGLVLDQIQDPRNFGAILRSAAYFNVRFVVYATDRQSELTPLVVRTSAGGVFSLKLVPVVNISRALQQLKAAGAWTLATTLEEASPLSSVTRDRPFVLVMGNEGKGVRLEVARQSDMRVKIPGGAGTVDSLNVAVATGVCLSALSPQVDTAAPEESAEEDFEEAENIYVGDED